MLLTRMCSLVAALVLAATACSGTTADVDDVGADEPSAAVDATSDAATDEPYGIAELEVTSLGGDRGDWVGMKAAGGHLFAHERLEADGLRLVRFDPTTGSVLAERELTNVEGWTVAPSAVVGVSKDRRYVTLLDPATLEVRHEVDLGEDARAGNNGDTPRTDEFWLGLRRRDSDQLQGIYTDMAAIRLDLDTGEVAERHDAPPCGASSVTQLDDHLVMGVVCAEQVATLELATGATTSYEAFPAGVTVLSFDDAAWLRWKDFGYLGRLRPGDEAIETLDLNADGPLLSEISPQMGGPRGIWVTGTPVEADVPPVLYVIDTDTFTVVARAWTPAPVAFIDGVGYVIADGRLATFDPASVVGGAADEVVRPDTGPPAAYEPRTDEERAIVDAFTTVFDPDVPTDTVAQNLVDDPETLELRNQLIDLAQQLYPGVSTRVTALAVGDGAASLAYVFLLDGQLAFVPLTGSLDFDGTHWRVTRDTVCRLAAQAGISEC